MNEAESATVDLQNSYGLEVLQSPTLQAPIHDDQYPEVIREDNPPEIVKTENLPEPVNSTWYGATTGSGSVLSDGSTKHTLIFGLRKRTLYAILGLCLFVILGIALGAGLGVGLEHSHSNVSR